MVRGHRNDIDGLRAVAILPVLFFHANLWPFASGYVGVDVFFVISGYLITGLILREQETTGFSLVNFYDRRIRRILPALFLVLAVTTVAALFVLLPDELSSFGKNLAGAVLFCVNFVYWLRDSAYFAPNAGENPLLHIWSLSVEEQFYLIWPLLLVYLSRFRRFLPWTVLLLGAASLAMSLVFDRVNVNVAFYLLPARAWQLLLGGFIAAGGLNAPQASLPRNALAAAGLTMIAAAALLPGDVAFPGWNGLAGAVGTGAILFAAEGGGNIVSFLLRRRVAVFIGQISYSLYLWHLPLLVFARLYLNRELTVAEAAVVLLSAFAVSTLTWKYVEQPVRQGRFARWRGMPASFPAAAAVGGALLVVAATLVATGGLPWRVAGDVQAVDAFAYMPLEGKWCGPGSAPADACFRGDAHARDVAVLWGDSHARALAPGLDGFVAARHLRLHEYTRGACPPLLFDTARLRNSANGRRCAPFNDAVLREILAAKNVRLVILQARWEIAGSRQPSGEATDSVEHGIAGVIAALRRGGISVLLVGNVPTLSFVPAHCYGRERMFGRDPSPCLAVTRAAVQAQFGPSDAELAHAAARYPGVQTFFPSSVLCDRVNCHAFFAGKVLYVDMQHLSRDGALLIGSELTARLAGWPPAR